MGMSINTNVSALNAQRNLEGSQLRLSQAYSRLSSGRRINTAADDATGLVISQRFGSHLRGMTQGMRNAGDGISLAQAAESALAESTNLLQRIRELAVTAANDVNSDSDRLAIQDEVDELVDEIGRIGSQTRFNGQTVLDGSFADAFFHVGAYARESIRLNLRDARADALGRQAVKTAQVTTDALADGDLLINGVTIRATEAVDDELSTAFSTGSAIAKAAAINDGTRFHGVTAKVLPTVLVADDEITGGVLENGSVLTINGYTITDVQVSGRDADHSLVEAINEVVEQTGVVASLDERGHLVLRAEDGRNIDVVAAGNAAAVVGLDSTLMTGSINLASEELFTVSGANEAFIGFGDNEQVAVTSDEAVSTISVRTRQDANDTILKIDRALAQVAADRSALGAAINRMQATVSQLTSSIEAVTGARSRIEDADFAAESSNLAREQILQQAGVSILAQANTAGQQVLGLLQS